MQYLTCIGMKVFCSAHDQLEDLTFHNSLNIEHALFRDKNMLGPFEKYAILMSDLCCFFTFNPSYVEVVSVHPSSLHPLERNS